MDRKKQNAFLVGCGLFLFSGCVEQTMTIQSDPPGAVVYMNDQELGRTPVTKDFTWYGDYDVQVRLEGYETLSTHKMITAPAWNWVPFDLLANLVPMTFKDHRDLKFTLKPMDATKEDPQSLLSRADYLKGKLEGSAFTREPTPRTATRSTSKPTTVPAKVPGVTTAP